MNIKYLSIQNLSNIRNKKIINLLKWNILELWCGWWFVPNYLKNENKKNRYTWVDFREKIISDLIIAFPWYNFIHHDLDDILNFTNEEFDTVIAIAVIEHIYNQKNFLKTATKKLKIGGKLIITTPSNFGNDIIYPLMCKMWIRWGKWVLNDHITIYNKDRFEVVANDFGLELEHYEFFEFFCNQLVIFKKMKHI